MKKAKYVIVDYRIDNELKNKLLEYAEKVVFTCQMSTYDSICGHADIQIFKLSSNKIICAPECYEYYKLHLKDINVICGNNNPGNKYPEDVLYNACFNNNILIHNLKYTDKRILSEIESKDINLINVKQGYTKCSICELNNNSFITDDDSIFKVLKSKKINVLKVPYGIVKLENFDYGFIGGASGKFNSKIFFTGKINDEIRTFCEINETAPVELSEKPLIDIGTIIFLN